MSVPISIEPELLRLLPHEWVPNNAHLPVMIYHRVLDPTDDLAADFEKVFGAYDWPAQWRDGIYDFHHYHSTAHEVLGVASGSARIMLGGPAGRVMEITAGDALVLPVGTGHRCVQAFDDFLVVGAYPRGQQWDICREAPDAQRMARMRALPLPPTDPLYGRKGPLTRYWC